MASLGLKFVSNGDGTCYVSGIGTCKDTNIVIPSISPDGDTVTSIGDQAFKDNTKIISISFENDNYITSIGLRAFHGCTKLKSIIFEGNKLTNIKMYAFYNCESIVNIDIPLSVTSIGEGAFYECTSITNINIPKNVNNIDVSPFGGCNNLSSITVDTENTKYISKNNCLIDIENKTIINGCKTSIIPDDGSVDVIGEKSFRGCIGLTKLDIPNTIKRIAAYAFSGCTNIKSIHIPNSVISIDPRYNIVTGCSSLESITGPAYTDTNNRFYCMDNCLIDRGNKSLISGCKNSIIPNDNSVDEIQWNAFYGCTGLITIQIPVNIKYIRDTAFSNCINLETIKYYGTQEQWDAINKVSDSGSEWDRNAGSATPNGTYRLICVSEGLEFTSNNDGTCYVSGIGSCNASSVIIPEKSPDNDIVIGIGNRAFCNYSNLISIDIPECIKYIETEAFSYCINLVDIFFRHGSLLEVIGIYAFSGCINLESIEIPKNVTKIKALAFSKCEKLNQLEIPENVNQIDYGITEGCINIETLLVKSSNLKYYSINNCIIDTSSKTLIAGCKSSIIPKDGSVINIGDRAFSCQSTLKNINIPDCITSIGEWAFFQCKFTNINIPCNITTIEESVFNNCDNITHINIPTGVTKIGKRAFCNCNNLKTINIPKTITNIGDSVFYECFNLETIQFMGIEEEWNTIEKGTDWDTLAGSDTGNGTYKVNYIFELLVNSDKSFIDALSGISILTENTLTDKYISIPMNYLDIVKLNNPSNIKRGKTLFGIEGTNDGSTTPDKQAAVVIHDKGITTIFPFYGTETELSAVTWTVESDKITFSNDKTYSFTGSSDVLGLSTKSDFTITENDFSIGETGQSLISDQIVEYWVVYDEVYIERPNKEVKNILLLGNSFSHLFTAELYGLADADGYKLNLANLHKPGCSVIEHLTYLNDGSEAYLAFYVRPESKNGTHTVTDIKTIKGALDYAKENFGSDWDIISLQNHFHPTLALNYAKAVSQTTPAAKTLYDYIKENHPNATPIWHQTWAYDIGYGVAENYVEGFDVPTVKVADYDTQKKQYENIKKVSQLVASENGINLVPAGDAWQIARDNTLIGNTMCARLGINGDLGDYFHDGDIGGGQYLNACIWYEVLMARSCIGNTWRPSNYELSEEKIAILQEAAHEAVATVYGPGYCKEYEPVTTTVYIHTPDGIKSATSTSNAPVLSCDDWGGSGCGIYLDGEFIYGSPEIKFDHLSVLPNSIFNESEGDILIDSSKTLTVGNIYEYYIIDSIGDVRANDVTTVKLYNADDSLRGKLTTTNPNPYLYFAYNDSGEVGITDGVPAENTGLYFGNDIMFQYGGGPMAGLSVANDGNLSSTDDIPWTNYNSDPQYATGNKKALTAGKTYIYYAYSEADLNKKITTVYFKWNDGTSIGIATTDVAEPYIYGDNAYGDGLGIYLGSYLGSPTSTPSYDKYFYTSPAYRFDGFSLAQNGEKIVDHLGGWYGLTAGETYIIYVRHDNEPPVSSVTTTVNIAGHELTTTSSNPRLAFDYGSCNFELYDGDALVDTYSPSYTYTGGSIPLIGSPEFTEYYGSVDLTPGQTYYYSYYYDDGSETFAVMINHNGNVSWAHSAAGEFSVEWTSGNSVKIGGYVDGNGNYYCNTSFIGLSTEDDGNITGDNDIPYGTDVRIGMWPEGGVERSYVYYLYDNDEGESVTTVNIAGHELTTTSSNPYLEFDIGSGNFTLYDGDVQEDGYSPTDTYEGEYIPLLGAPDLNGKTRLTPGQTYYYSYYYDDGSPQFAVMINQNGNITWQKAVAGCFYITWINSGHVEIGGGSVGYYSDTTFIGLSTEDDGNVTGTNDIPYGTDIDTGHGDGADKRSYVYYLYDETNSTVPTKTTVIIMNADGTERGRMSTDGINPKIFCDTNDSGRLYLTGTGDIADSVEWLDVAINAYYPAGFSVSNDYNITSTDDFTWDEGLNGIALTAGNTYTYYVYSEGMLYPDYGTTTCAYCGGTMSNESAYYPYCSESCRDTANTCTSHNYELLAEDDSSKTYRCSNCSSTYSVFKTTCGVCSGTGISHGSSDTDGVCDNCGGSGVVWE